MARGGRTGRNTLMQISKIRDLQRKHMKQDAPTRRLSTFLGALLVSVPCFASLSPLPDGWLLDRRGGHEHHHGL